MNTGGDLLWLSTTDVRHTRRLYACDGQACIPRASGLPGCAQQNSFVVQQVLELQPAHGELHQDTGIPTTAAYMPCPSFARQADFCWTSPCVKHLQVYSVKWSARQEGCGICHSLACIGVMHQPGFEHTLGRHSPASTPQSWAALQEALACRSGTWQQLRNTPCTGGKCNFCVSW